MSQTRTSRAPAGASDGASLLGGVLLLSLLLHLVVVFFVFQYKRTTMEITPPAKKKPVVIQLVKPEPPPPPPPPEPPKTPPPPPPKIPPPPKPVTPPPPRPVTTAAAAPQAPAVPPPPPPAPPAPPAPPPPSEPKVGTSVPASYYASLQSLIQNAIVYPPTSVRAGEEGSARVRVHFDRSGKVLDVELISRTGFQKLDNEAKAVFGRIGRFPAVAAGVDADEFIIELPINFSLE